MTKADAGILAVLGCILTAGAIVAGRYWAPTFDEYWILYYGETGPLGFLIDEFRRDNHPFPFYSVVRLFTEPSWPPVFGRLAATVSGVATLPVAFVAFRALALSRATAHAATAVLATSLPFVSMAVCARSYSMATLLVLLAAACLLHALGTKSTRSLAAALVFLALAPWPLYSAAFPVVGLGFGFAVVALAHRGSRAWLREAASKAPTRVAGGVAFVIGVLLVLYFRWTERPVLRNYLTAYFPRPDESMTDFVLRGTNLNLNSFFSLSLPDSSVVGLVVMAAVILLACSGWRAHPGRVVIALALVVSWFGVAAAAIAGKHPFGGIARHQYCLYPLLVLTAICALVRVMELVRAPTLARPLVILAAGLLLNITAFVGPPFEDFADGPLFATEYRALAASVNEGGHVLTDRYSYLACYGSARSESGWTHEARDTFGLDTDFDRVRATIGGHAVTLVRDNANWHDYLGRAGMITRCGPVMQALGLSEIRVLVLRHEGRDMPADRGAHEAAIRASATAHGLTVEAHTWLDQGELYTVKR